MGHDVVELTGDPLALAPDSALRALVALTLEPQRALLERTRVQATDPCRVSKEPRHNEDQLRLDERHEDGRDPCPSDEGDRQDATRKRGRGHRPPSLDTLADGVDRHQDAEPSLQRLALGKERDLDDGRTHDHRQDREREPAADDQRQALEQQ